MLAKIQRKIDDDNNDEDGYDDNHNDNEDILFPKSCI